MVFTTYLTIIIPAVITFIITLAGVLFLKAYLYGAGVVGEDHNKAKPVLLPGSGGLAVAFGIVSGILIYTFGGSIPFFTPVASISILLAVSLSIVLIATVGFLDDINVKGRRVMSTDLMDRKKGLAQWQKPLLTFVGAIPLMAVDITVKSITLPFIGTIALGILYPLIIVPLAVIFVSNAFNLLGGFDGLQPGMAIIAGIGLVIYSFITQSYLGILLSVLFVSALVAFLPFNLYKASMLPGDSFTYAVGATLVAIMATSKAEVFGVIIFIPWIVEFFLHLRRKFKVSDLGIRQKDGSFKAPYGNKIYSLTHLVMNLKNKPTEQDVTNYLCAVEALFVVLALGLKFAGVL
jgi:UDP-N-acetylglucosamine--dolichyl-phosphate N-acetylglucosaminephosphotransferase